MTKYASCTCCEAVELAPAPPPPRSRLKLLRGSAPSCATANPPACCCSSCAETTATRLPWTRGLGWVNYGTELFPQYGLHELGNAIWKTFAAGAAQKGGRTSFEDFAALAQELREL